MSGLLVPALLALAALAALLRGKPVFPALTEGIRGGLTTVLRIFPPVAAVLTAAAMFRASGALEALTSLLRPALKLLGVPPETAGLMLLRPLSGSGALALGTEVIGACGPDSEVGRIAAVMLGGTETAFYTVSVYFGAAGVRRAGRAIPAALLAELVGCLTAGIFVRLLMRR